MNEHQIRMIRFLKGLNEDARDEFIPVRNDKNILIGNLVPITRERAKDKETVLSLVRWRKKHMRVFLTQFEPTYERTRGWLENVVLKDDTRIFFLIMTESGRAIGNLGVCNITEDSAELDNLIRGEMGGDPNLIAFAEVSIINWLYKALGVSNIRLHVFSNNIMTMMLHSSVGFTRERCYRLTKIQDGADLIHVVDYSDEPAKGDVGYLKMRLDVEAFRNRHKWLF